MKTKYPYLEERPKFIYLYQSGLDDGRVTFGVYFESTKKGDVIFNMTLLQKNNKLKPCISTNFNLIIEKQNFPFNYHTEFLIFLAFQQS